MISRLLIAFVLLLPSGLANAKNSANDNARLPVPLWMGQRFQEVLNLPLFYFLAQRPNDVSLIDLGLVLNGEHTDMKTDQAGIMRAAKSPVLMFHTLFLDEGGVARGFRPMNGTEYGLSMAFTRIFKELRDQVFTLEGLLIEYSAAAMPEQKKALRIRALQLRKDMVKSLSEGLELAGDVGTSVHDNLRGHGAVIEEDPTEIIIDPYFKFPRATVTPEDMTAVVFANMHLFLNVPPNAFHPLRLSDGSQLWIGSVFDLNLSQPWHDRTQLRGLAQGYTYWVGGTEDAPERLLMRDKTVWQNIQAYVMTGTKTKGVIPEPYIRPEASAKVPFDCSQFLGPASLIVPGFQN